MASYSHSGLLLICLSQFSRRSRLPGVVENLRVPSPGTRTAYMLAPSRFHLNGYVWDPSGPLTNPDQTWPDLTFVTAWVKHCFPLDDRRGVNNPDTWRNFLPKTVTDRKIILVDTRQLSNLEQDRGREKNSIGRHPGIIDQLLTSGTGMHLLQSTWGAVERETKLDPKLVVIDFCNANRHRSVAKGTIMSAMCVEKGRQHGLLHLTRKDKWKYMPCEGSCSSYFQQLAALHQSQ